MSFDHIIGNEAIKAYLKKGLTNKTLPHGFLFSGPSGVGKSQFAKALASAILKTNTLETHPDFHLLTPESKSGLHSIDSLRLLIDEVHKVSFKGDGKVFILLDAHKMQTASANAILKTLEEPSPDTTLILVTQQANELLPTICSRLAKIDFKPIAEDEIASFLRQKGVDESLAKLSFGSIGKAMALAEKPLFEKEVFALLEKNMLYPDLLKQIEKVEKGIESEDPVEKGKNIEALFETILMWYRDQKLLQEDMPKKYLFFPNLVRVKQSIPNLEKVENLLEDAKEGVQRNLKLSSCLSAFLLRVESLQTTH